MTNKKSKKTNVNNTKPKKEKSLNKVYQNKEKIGNNASIKKKKSEIIKNDNELIKLLKIVLAVTGIMIVFYGITMVVTKVAKDEIDNVSPNKEKAIIQYKDIVIGTMLNKTGGEYYVLIKGEEDNRIAEYETLIKIIEAKEDAPTFYMANLTDSFNKKYFAKEANDSSNLEEFKVSGTTLVKIKDGEIDKTFSEYLTIRTHLNSIK